MLFAPRAWLLRWFVPRLTLPRAPALSPLAPEAAACAPVVDILPPEAFPALHTFYQRHPQIRPWVCLPKTDTLPPLEGASAVRLLLTLHSLPHSQALGLLRHCHQAALPLCVFDACLAERTMSLPASLLLGAALRRGSCGNYTTYICAGGIEGLLYAAGIVPYARQILFFGGLTAALYTPKC